MEGVVAAAATTLLLGGRLEINLVSLGKQHGSVAGGGGRRAVGTELGGQGGRGGARLRGWASSPNVVCFDTRTKSMGPSRTPRPTERGTQLTSSGAGTGPWFMQPHLWSGWAWAARRRPQVGRPPATTLQAGTRFLRSSARPPGPWGHLPDLM